MRRNDILQGAAQRGSKTGMFSSCVRANVELKTPEPLPTARGPTEHSVPGEAPLKPHLTLVQGLLLAALRAGGESREGARNPALPDPTRPSAAGRALPGGLLHRERPGLPELGWRLLGHCQRGGQGAAGGAPPVLLAVPHPGLRSGPLPCCPLATPCSPGQGSLWPHTLPRRHGLFPLLPAAFPAPPELCDATLRTTLQSPAGHHGGRAGALLHPRQLGSARLTVTPSPFPGEHPVSGAQGGQRSPGHPLAEVVRPDTIAARAASKDTPTRCLLQEICPLHFLWGHNRAGNSPGPGSTCPCQSYGCRCQGHRCRRSPGSQCSCGAELWDSKRSLGKRRGNPQGRARKARAGFGGNSEKSPQAEIKPLAVHSQPGREHSYQQNWALARTCGHRGCPWTCRDFAQSSFCGSARSHVCGMAASPTLPTVTCNSPTTFDPAASQTAASGWVAASRLLFSQLRDRCDLVPAVPRAGRAPRQRGVAADAGPDRCIPARQTETPGTESSQGCARPTGTLAGRDTATGSAAPIRSQPQDHPRCWAHHPLPPSTPAPWRSHGGPRGQRCSRRVFSRRRGLPWPPARRLLSQHAGSARDTRSGSPVGDKRGCREPRGMILQKSKNKNAGMVTSSRAWGI